MRLVAGPPHSDGGFFGSLRETQTQRSLLIAKQCRNNTTTTRDDDDDDHRQRRRDNNTTNFSFPASALLACARECDGNFLWC